MFNRKPKDFADRPMGEWYGLYSMYDTVAQECGPVFAAKNDGCAMRAYRALLQQVDRVDIDAYKLFRLGKYNNHDMKTVPETEPLEILAPPSQLDLIKEGENA